MNILGILLVLALMGSNASALGADGASFAESSCHYETEAVNKLAFPVYATDDDIYFGGAFVALGYIPAPVAGPDEPPIRKILPGESVISPLKSRDRSLTWTDGEKAYSLVLQYDELSFDKSRTDWPSVIVKRTVAAPEPDSAPGSQKEKLAYDTTLFEIDRPMSEWLWANDGDQLTRWERTRISASLMSEENGPGETRLYQLSNDGESRQIPVTTIVKTQLGGGRLRSTATAEDPRSLPEVTADNMLAPNGIPKKIKKTDLDLQVTREQLSCEQSPVAFSPAAFFKGPFRVFAPLVAAFVKQHRLTLQAKHALIGCREKSVELRQAAPASSSSARASSSCASLQDAYDRADKTREELWTALAGLDPKSLQVPGSVEAHAKAERKFARAHCHTVYWKPKGDFWEAKQAALDFDPEAVLARSPVPDPSKFPVLLARVDDSCFDEKEWSAYLDSLEAMTSGYDFGAASAAGQTTNNQVRAWVTQQEIVIAHMRR